MVIFINQIRHENRCDVWKSRSDDQVETPLNFYSSVRIDIRRIGAIKDKDEIVGNSDQSESS